MAINSLKRAIFNEKFLFADITANQIPFKNPSAGKRKLASNGTKSQKTSPVIKPALEGAE